MLGLLRVFDKFFRTVFWKVAVVGLLLTLVYSLIRIFIILAYLYNYYSTVHITWHFAYLLNDVYTWGIISTALLLMIILAGVFDFFSFLRLNKRFRSISSVINDIAKGDLQQRVDITSADEIGSLARNFNQMADTIAENIETLKATDRLRRELVANVAHDLGGPVTSIQGYVETVLMKEEVLTSQERRQFLGIILDNAKSLSKMVAELFDLSKFDAKNVVPQKESFSIVTLAADIASRFEPSARRKDVSLEIDTHVNVPLVFADLSLVERVLSNLLDNAINYTEQGGKIEIHFEIEEETLWTSVSDSGVGIAEEDLPHLFDRFYRVSKARSRKTGGAGLGLAIVRNIIAAHDREVRVDSTPGVGTTVSFSLPLGLPESD